MDINFNVKIVNYNERNGKLDIKASGVVKSNKFFPTYLVNGKNYIFKPLSKTKPLTTPLFSYAEVIWSNIINKYFMEAPVYQLSKCIGYTENEPKYYEHGCLVENILSKDEHLVNLLEYFMENKDEHVNIDDYVNYCLMFYDYIPIFESKLFQENYNLAEELAMHILVSILKADQNYHYENVAFICDENENIKRLAPMIDHEFSTMFLFPDYEETHKKYFNKFINNITIPDNVLYDNIEYIVIHYPRVVKKFKEGLEKLYIEIKKLKLQDNGFLEKSSTDSYQIGMARYKENDEFKAKILEQIIELNDIDLEKLNEIIISEIRTTALTFLDTIEKIIE